MSEPMGTTSAAHHLPWPVDLADEVRNLAERVIELKAALGQSQLEREEALTTLGDCVVKATEYGTQDGCFVAMYLLPTGPIHRAIPLLQRHGITVRPGFDGRRRDA